MAKGSRKQSARSAPVYRKVEQLLFWAEVVIDRLPKSLSFQERGKKIHFDLTDALVLIDLGLSAKPGAERLTYINALCVRMTDVKTHFRGLRERSKNPSERSIKELDPDRPADTQRLLTAKQYQTFISQMLQIDFEIANWANGNSGEPDASVASSADKID